MQKGMLAVRDARQTQVVHLTISRLGSAAQASQRLASGQRGFTHVRTRRVEACLARESHTSGVRASVVWHRTSDERRGSADAHHRDPAGRAGAERAAQLQ